MLFNYSFRFVAPKLLLSRTNNITVSQLNANIFKSLAWKRYNSTFATTSIPSPILPQTAVIDGTGSAVVESVASTSFGAYNLGTSWSPVGLVEHVLEVMHSTTGLPWWLTLTVFTVCLRLSFLPFSIRQKRFAENVKVHAKPIRKLQQAMQAAAEGKKVEEMQKAQQMYFEYVSQHNCSPFKMMGLSILPAVAFIPTFFAIRDIALAGFEPWKNGGALWFTDLVAADPTYALPIISSLVLYANIEISQREARAGNPQSVPSYFKWIMRGLPFIGLPYLLSCSAALNYYFLTANILTLFMTFFLNNRFVKRLLRLKATTPPTTTTSTIQ